MPIFEIYSIDFNNINPTKKEIVRLQFTDPKKK